MRVEFFTGYHGFVVDYLAEALRRVAEAQLHLRLIQWHFSLGSHLKRS